MVIEYQLRLGRQRQVWLIPLADETQGEQVKQCYPLTMHAIPERLRDASCGGAVQIDYLNFFWFVTAHTFVTDQLSTVRDKMPIYYYYYYYYSG